jgi:hypothetical protein
MPLIQSVLEQKLKSRINALEPKLKNALNSKTSGLYKAQSLIDIKLTDTSPESGFSLIKYKNDVWATTSNEWSKVLAKEIIKLLADDLSKIIASEVTSYIKSATIIVPPGQAVTAPAPAGIGTTTSPSVPANIT